MLAKIPPRDEGIAQHAYWISRSDTVDVRDAAKTAHSPQSTDVGEANARTIAQDAFDALVANGLVTTSAVDFANATIHHRMGIQGRSDGSSTQTWVAQYVFFAPIQIDGVVLSQLPRDLGVQIAVRRGGSVARIRIDAEGVASGKAGSQITGAIAPVALETASAQRDAANGYTPPVVVTPIGVRYLFPPGGNAAPAVPRQVFRVHSRILDEHGVAIGDTKANMLSYPVDQATPQRNVFPKASAVVLPSSQK